MKMKPWLILVIAFGLILSGCDNKKSVAHVDFPETIPGKVVFSTSRGQHAYSTGIYENGEIQILQEEGGLWIKLSPSGEKVLVAGYGGFDVLDLLTGSKNPVAAPDPKIRTNQEAWISSDEKILVISQNALGVREKIPYDLYRYDLNEKKWTKLTNFRPDEGILGFDVFKDGIHILCSYSSDYKGKERGTYIMDLETGAMRKIVNWAGSYEIMPDQKSFLAETAIRKGNEIISSSDFVLVDIETGKEKRLTFDGQPKSALSVSADGQWALYSATAGDAVRIFMLHIPTGATKEMFDRPVAYAGEVAHDRNPNWWQGDIPKKE